VGFLVDALQRDGWSAVGIEISPVLVACGKTSFGLDLRVASFDSLEGFTDLDAVTLVEIIEHLFDPVAVLRQLRGWLRPGGGVYITTPNFDCDDRRRAGMAWNAICADHYQYFTVATLTRALETTGFQVRWIAETGSRGINEPGGNTLQCIAVTQ
jgi:2-polyprenyl-3-methyl-5-hydroxy-6-metoxy-1,4-benzoquinol methylase